MRKSLRNRQLKRKSRKRKHKGGSYYSYNRNPLRFTSNSIQTGGSFSVNIKDTLLPQGIVNAGRNLMYNSSSNTMNGYYPAVNPDPTVQPIGTSYMLL
jgi:hypothetical protein